MMIDGEIFEFPHGLQMKNFFIGTMKIYFHELEWVGMVTDIVLPYSKNISNKNWKIKRFFWSKYASLYNHI